MRACLLVCLLCWALPAAAQEASLPEAPPGDALVQLRSRQQNLSFHLLDEGRDRRICIAPCEQRLRVGSYHLGIALDRGATRSVGVVEVPPGVVLLDATLVDGEPLRVAGWTTLIIGFLAAAAIFVGGAGTGPSPQVIGISSGFAIVSLALGLPGILANDGAYLQMSRPG